MKHFVKTHVHMKIGTLLQDYFQPIVSKVVRCSFVHPSGKAAERSRQEHNGAAHCGVAWRLARLLCECIHLQCVFV